jgi:hypothetical protein
MSAPLDVHKELRKSSPMQDQSKRARFHRLQGCYDKQTARLSEIGGAKGPPALALWP